jgi:hypothetical protein
MEGSFTLFFTLQPTKLNKQQGIKLIHKLQHGTYNPLLSR